MKKLFVSLAMILIVVYGMMSCKDPKSGLAEEPVSPVLKDSVINDSQIYEGKTFDTVVVLKKKAVKRIKKKVPAFEKADFDEIAVEFFFRLAEETDGEAYFAKSAKEVKSVILDVLKKHAKSGTDLVFLIDKTGSMTDDIRTIRSSVDILLKAIESIGNIRVGMAFYGDRNVDDPWYEKTDLSEDYSRIKYLIENVSTTGGGDMPESVNDGIYKTVNDFSWDKNHNKMILVLGDAPSLKPPKAKYTESQVVSICKSKRIKVNLYPVIIGLGFSDTDDDETETEGFVEEFEEADTTTTAGETEVAYEAMELNIYPNPVKADCAIEMDEWAKYSVEVYDIKGRLVMTKKFDDYQCRLNFWGKENGVYVVKVRSDELHLEAESSIVVQH